MQLLIVLTRTCSYPIYVAVMLIKALGSPYGMNMYANLQSFEEQSHTASFSGIILENKSPATTISITNIQLRAR